MATVLTVVCDMCPPNDGHPGVETIRAGGIPIDLCKSHAARWRALVKAKQTSAAKKAAARKAPAKKAAVKKASAKKPAGRKTAAKKPVAKRASAGKSAVKKAAVKRTSARKTAVRKTAAKKATRGVTAKRTAKFSSGPAVDNSAVRAWARSNGIEVTQRGPLKADVIEQFLAAPVNAPTAQRAKAAAFSHQS